MPTPQLIAAADSLETGFRDKYNSTAGAVSITATINSAGVVTFKGLGNATLFSINLGAILALKNEIPPPYGGEPISFGSATEETEGTGKIATADEAADGTNEFKWITPAVLAHVLANFEGVSKTLLQQIQAAANNGNELPQSRAAMGFGFPDMVSFSLPSVLDMQGYGGVRLVDSQAEKFFGISGGYLSSDATVADLHQADAIFRTIGVRVLPVATSLTNILVTEQLPDGTFTLRSGTLDMLASALVPKIIPALAQAGITPNGGALGNKWKIIEVCDVTVTRPHDSENKFTITSGMIGSPQAHNLQTAGTNIIPYLLNSNNQPDSEMIISFPDSDHYQIDYPSGGSGYDGGKLKLERIS